MPLIRVSDEVYQHLKDSGKDGESMDATIRRISNLSVAKAFRKYTEREKLIPLEAYRWMILSAYIPSGDNAKLTRAELQKYVEHKEQYTYYHQYSLSQFFFCCSCLDNKN